MPKKQTMVNKTVGAEGRKNLNKMQRTAFVRPVLGDKKTFVSSNRYGFLEVMDQDYPSDVQEEPVDRKRIGRLIYIIQIHQHI